MTVVSEQLAYTRFSFTYLFNRVRLILLQTRWVSSHVFKSTSYAYNVEELLSKVLSRF